MKKTLLIILGVLSALFLSSCSLGSVIDHFSRDEEEPTQTSAKTRVYMDEIRGELINFDGNLITLKKDAETSYVFDVSEASLECEGGMVTGDSISVIYEGKLPDFSTDTSTVHAIKVTDELHKASELQERTGYVQVTGLTPNTISVRSKHGNTATYLISGVEQYYQNGVQPGLWTYIHFKGFSVPGDDMNPSALDGSHIKVISISDIDPLIPAPIPAVKKDPAQPAPTEENSFRAIIQNLNLNSLTVLPTGAKQNINLNLSGIPVYLKGGAAPGSYVNIYYNGTFNGTTLNGIQITGIIGDDPESLSERNITSTITGAIVGSTLNTITLQTNDGATITCNTQNARDLSSNNLAIGSVVCVTFNPADNRNSNVYQCIQIKDAL